MNIIKKKITRVIAKFKVCLAIVRCNYYFVTTFDVLEEKGIVGTESTLLPTIIEDALKDYIISSLTKDLRELNKQE